VSVYSGPMACTTGHMVVFQMQAFKCEDGVHANVDRAGRAGKNMKIVGWLGIGLIVSFLVAGAAVTIPGAASGIQSFVMPSHGNTGSVSAAPQPAWNTGNLCTPSGLGTADVSCVSLVSAASYPLWYNFSAGELQGGTVTVTIYGSSDCINLNFHSFYTTIVVNIYGSHYSCPGTGIDGVAGPGVNVVVNSEGDAFTLNQLGSYYTTNLVTYGTTTYVSTVQDGSYLLTTVTYIGTTAGFGTCPSGITDGRVAWSEVSFGSYNTFSTIFVDGTNVAHAPPNYAYSTEPLLPPDGAAFGFSDLYGNATTQTAPTGSCSYLGV